MGKENKGTENWNRNVIPERVKERAFNRHELELDCWISTYSTGSHGYAQIGWGGSEITKRGVVLAHRASWEYVNGPMPIGKTLDHLCKSKKCVNPDHMRVLENYENARRTSGRDWPLGECVNGHSNEHLEVFPDGKKGCGVCARTIWRAKPRGCATPREPRQPKLRSVPTGPRIRKPEPRKPPRTHCRNGHEKTPENLYTRPTGTTECLPCKQEYAKVWVNRRNAA